MLRIFQGQRPDITPAQLVALLVGGVPVVANLLHVFGVYDLSTEQQDSLIKTLQWGGLVAIGLLGADAGLRSARGHADARVKVAALSNPSEPVVGSTVGNGAGPAPAAAPGAVAPGAPSSDEQENLPTDAEEFAHQPGGAAMPALGTGGAGSEFESGGDLGPESRVSPAVPQDEL
jgi:hypothetical protein